MPGLASRPITVKKDGVVIEPDWDNLAGVLYRRDLSREGDPVRAPKEHRAEVILPTKGSRWSDADLTTINDRALIQFEARLDSLGKGHRAPVTLAILPTSTGKIPSPGPRLHPPPPPPPSPSPRCDDTPH